jgi:hypothetical protein
MFDVYNYLLFECHRARILASAHWSASVKFCGYRGSCALRILGGLQISKGVYVHLARRP